MRSEKETSPSEIERHPSSKQNSEILDTCIGFSSGYLFFLFADYKQKCTNDADASLVLTLSIPMVIIFLVFSTTFLFKKYKDYAKNFNSNSIFASYTILIFIYFFILSILLLTNSNTFAKISITLGIITTLIILVLYKKIELLFDKNKIVALLVSPIIGFAISFTLHLSTKSTWNDKVTTKNLLCPENYTKIITPNQLITDCEQITLNCVQIQTSDNPEDLEKCTINSLTCRWKK